MLIRKLYRTALCYKAQFISMIIMITLGMGMFLGFNMEWYTIEYDTDKYFTATNYADYRLYSTESGFTEDDLDAIKNIDGVDAATRFLSVNLDINGESGKALSLDVSEDYNVSTFTVISGEDYDENGDGFWLSDKFALANGINLGDSLSLSFKGTEIQGEVVGLIKASEHMICLADSNQLMPDYSTFGYAYISPKKLKDVIKAKLYSTYEEELTKSGVPSEFITDSMLSPFVSDSLIEETEDSIFAQINILSDLEKSELEEAVKTALGRTVMVSPKSDHVVYAQAMGEAEEGKTMGSILPVLFLAIAILTMVTTMHRIAAKEKLQIGTLKALGFHNRRILRHYTSYGLTIGIIGTGLGVGLGYLVCGLIMSEDGMMGTYFDMPEWISVIPPFCYPAMILTVLLLTLISYLSVRQQLKGTAADALRPYAPKRMRKSKLEKLRVWKKLKFGTKWNLRDLSRHKSRSAMTLIGIIGCMTLMVGGMGMSDTMQGFLDTLDNDISCYTTKVNLVDGADKEDAVKLSDELDGDRESLMGISLDGKTVSLDIIDNPHELVNIIDEQNKRMTLSDDGVYLCLRLKERAQVGEYIEFSPYGSQDTFKAKVIGYNRSLTTECITMTERLADSLGIDYEISSIYTDRNADEIEANEIISGKQSKAQLMDTYDSFIEIMDAMVIILIIAAVILGIVVLYNLGILSYLERSRELATLKVLGFNSKAIGRLLISQNIWLTVAGVILGLPAGVLTLQWLITALATEYELKLMLGPLTYLISVSLTFGVSLLVSFIVARKNRKINMVEALKGAE